MAAATRGMALRRVWGALSALGVVAAHLAFAPAAAADEEAATVDFGAVEPVTAGDPAEVAFVVANATDPDDGQALQDLTVSLACAPGCGGLGASFDHAEIEPGESGEGLVSGTTPESPGELELTLTVDYVVDTDDGPSQDAV
jgi:hypothetical protein